MGLFFYPQESVKRSGLRREETGCGLRTLCLMNTWSQCWRATSNPGKEIRLQLDASGAFGTAGPEVPAADPNTHQAMGSYCYPTARRPLYLTIPEAGSVFSGWHMPPKPGTAVQPPPLQALQVRQGREYGRGVKLERSGLGSGWKWRTRVKNSASPEEEAD